MPFLYTSCVLVCALRFLMIFLLLIKKKKKIIEAVGIHVQENGSEEIQNRIKASIMKMAAFFPDPSKAEDSFHKLNQMKDNNTFKTLASLLDELKIRDAQTTRVSLLYAFLIFN
jgi:predicted CopG family antitoxin